MKYCSDCQKKPVTSAQMGFLLVYCEHYQQLSWLVTVLVPNPILNVSFEVLKCLNRNITKLKIY